MTGEQGKAGHIFHLISMMTFVCTSSGKLAHKKVPEPTVGFVSGGHMCHKANETKASCCVRLCVRQMLILHKMVPKIELMEFNNRVVLPWWHSNCGTLSSDKVGVPHPTITTGSRKSA